VTASSLFLLFVLLSALGALLSGVLPERRVALALAWTASLASASLVLGAGFTFVTGEGFSLVLARMPLLGALGFQVDRLSALFLFVTGLVFLPASVYSAGYLVRYEGRYSLRIYGVFYHLLLLATALTLAGSDLVTFLLDWRLMSVFCMLLVGFENRKRENTQAGYLLLAMTEAGVLAATLGVLVIAGFGAPGLDFASLRGVGADLRPAAAWAVFLLTFFGFSVKAGLIPGSSWLPKAHPAAPAPVSAILSGCVLNLGIYGIVRVNLDLIPVRYAGEGLVVLIVGSLTALIGILYATIDPDMKRMLAFSSIENMGLVAVGLGAGMVFLASGLPVLAAMGFVVAFYHMTNHSLYKTLLFLGAGGVDFRTGTRDMNRMGGLLRAMPYTGLFFLAGALSIAAFPPFNGFVSEWLTLQTLLQSAQFGATGVKVAFALCGAALALTAALAVTCFVKAFGMSFLGPARSKGAEQTRELPRSMLWPMGLLAAACLVLGLTPTYVIPALDTVAAPLAHGSITEELVPPFFSVGPSGDARYSPEFVKDFHDLGAQAGRGWLPGRGLVVLHPGGEKNPVVFAMSTAYTAVVLAALLAGLYLVVRWATRQRTARKGLVWDGGVRRLFPDMTYTATGFSNPVRVVFQAIFRPTTQEDTRESVGGHFRTAVTQAQREPFVLDRLFLEPLTRWIRHTSALAARPHHSGRVNLYAATVLLVLLAVLVLNWLRP
jgi:hydrogenase-4 component B